MKKNVYASVVSAGVDVHYPLSTMSPPPVHGREKEKTLFRDGHTIPGALSRFAADHPVNNGRKTAEKQKRRMWSKLLTRGRLS